MSFFDKNSYDADAVREDGRKVSVVLLAAGIIGVILTNDKVMWYEGIALGVVGFILWVKAVKIIPGSEKEKTE